MKKSLTNLLIFSLLCLVSVSYGQQSEFFDKANFKGAFGSSNWLKGWTALDHYQYLPDYITSSGTIVVKDGDINSGDVIYWTADNTYILDGFVFVEEGAILNIEAGTVVKGKAGQGENASALIISRGAKLFAEGTAEKPIIFTAEEDDVTDPYDLSLPKSNLWGGLIILGKATINTTSGEGNIEGIPAELRTAYGGNDDDDCSGILKYVSIRHGGTDIGAGKEINGLTLGGVGRGTTIDYIEVFNNNDDGFEWFGGTVNVKHLVSAFNVDDAFDHDEGYRGKMQFLFAIQGEETGNRLGEHDGGTDPEDGEPYSFPHVYNATLLGSGKTSVNPENDHMFKIRDFWGGSYKNSIFGDFPGDAMDVEDLTSGNDSKKRLDNGEIIFKNNLYFEFGAGNDISSLGAHDYESAYLSNSSHNNAYTNPNLGGINRKAYTNGLDPRPLAKGAAYNNSAPIPDDEFFEHVNYKGAFGSSNWLKGWTALEHYGYLTNDKTPANTVVVKDEDINAKDKVYWTADNTYILDGFVFVEEGAELNIEAGTVIKGKPGQGENASALIISRGARLYAEGTGVAPIIFTAEEDDVTDPYDLTLPKTNLWGGLILLGKAKINTTTGEGNIEGIPAELRTTYGGNSDNDCSGILRYISIRHGGTDVGSGKEINGLTLGAVGRGTTIDHVEVFNNNDDGFEWFGGAVNAKYLISAFNVDDAFDHDEGIRGKMQYLFAIQDKETGNRLGEHDGGTDPEDGAPYTFSEIYNVTFLGSGKTSSNPENDHMFKIRDYWGGSYKNSIFGDYPGDAMDIEDLASGNDSKMRLDAGEIIFQHNIFFDFGAGNTLNSLGAHSYESDFLGKVAYGNIMSNPNLGSISRTAYSKSLDPCPAHNGIAYKDLTDYITGVEESASEVIPANYTLSQNYPNPFNPTTKIEFAIPAATNVRLVVYNILGQKVVVLLDGYRNAGAYTVNWDASSLASGVYIYSLETDNYVKNKKMTLLK